MAQAKIYCPPLTRSTACHRHVTRPHVLIPRLPSIPPQAKIYWDLEHYAMVEKIFRQSAEFCSEHDLWKLNVAHVFFLQARARATPPRTPTPQRPCP